MKYIINIIYSLILLLLFSSNNDIEFRKNTHKLFSNDLEFQSKLAWKAIKLDKPPTAKQTKAYNKLVKIKLSRLTKFQLFKFKSYLTLRVNSQQLKYKLKGVDNSSFKIIDGIKNGYSYRIIPSEEPSLKRKDTFLEGLGVPVIIKLSWTNENSMISKNGLWLPAVALIDLDKDELYFQDPVNTKKSNIKFSANYTKAIKRNVSDSTFQFPVISSLFNLELFSKKLGLRRITSFSPKKEVCILIHGLMSNPYTWEKFLVESYADPKIRDKYEFWVFGYPSGMSPIYTASYLRKEINNMINFRIKNGSLDTKITLVGHSLGGVLSSYMVGKSIRNKWDDLFKVDINKLNLSKSDKKALNEIFFYEPITNIKKVIFCATPHYGSNIANNFSIKLISKLIEQPKKLKKLSHNIIKNNNKSLTLKKENNEYIFNNSIEELIPVERYNPKFIKNKNVSFYSIIANYKSNKAPLDKRSDAIVSYLNSHLSDVKKEKIIHRSFHGVHKNSYAIKELIDVLKEP